MPIDLSKVLFLCTANDLDTLHPAVLDRMEIIEVAGYTFEEKQHILNKYLLPQAITKAGLEHHQDKFTIGMDTRDYLIDNYCRSPGVRSLKKYINQICERIAFKIVENESKQGANENIKVTIDTLDDFIGQAKYMSKKFYEHMPAGVVIGLAYNSRGGAILYIESKRANDISEKGRIGSLKVTGQLGSVMQESSAIALTYARDFIGRIDYDETVKQQALDFLQHTDIHIHFPEGSTPKDGPSAGITITTALVSLALGKPIPQDIGMTGEISLNGKVLPIGGVKEKTMAATREGLKQLIFPKVN